MQRDRTYENISYDELFSVLLRQFKRPLKPHGVELTDELATEVAQRIVERQSHAQTTAILEALIGAVNESEEVLSHWGLTFEKSLDIKMDDMPGWETTTEFIELANERSNAELRIAAGSALIVLMGNKRFVHHLLHLAGGSYGDETVIARRALAFASGIPLDTADWFAHIKEWASAAEVPLEQRQLQRLKTLLARISDIKGAAGLLGWDQRTYMPPGAVQGRADQAATLAGLAHEYFTTHEIGELLEDLADRFEDYDSDEASLVRVLSRDYQKLSRIPAALLMQIQQVGAYAREAWQQARTTNNFSLFQPHLEKMLELQIQLAETLNASEKNGGRRPHANLYSALLDRFEPGMTHEVIDGIFSALKPQLIELVKAINAKVDAVDDSVLRRSYPKEQQLAFGRLMSEKLGYDFNRGRLDLSAHPFTSTFHRDDVRITTRVNENYVLTCIGSTIHETGHALHRQNLSPTLYRSNIEGTGLAVAETLSRYYENIVGLSREYWSYFFPKAQEFFLHLQDTELETWYHAMNKSFPSLIRTDADEVTYGLHIILRFELENEMINGQLQVADLPRVWNERMEAYLGIVPPDDSDGVLQDIHWSQGGWGYFPDYLLGTMFASQLDEKLLQEQPHIKADWERGEFGGLLAWLTEKIMKHGGKYTFPELAQRATGKPFSWQPYMSYLQKKYGEIYKL